SLEALREHLREDRKGRKLLEKLLEEVPVKDNSTGVPSLWYMPLVGGENFFDGFGFTPYVKRFHWERIPLDTYEQARRIANPLLPALDRIHAGELPKKWDNRLKRFVTNDDWLLLETAVGR
ncbi:MAG TPA: hypothetical protein VJ180_04710, partial [Pyrinomonadaceae bacterium]|nr:hypothetical protein [Pyrinomonadaceae bacterium]